MKKIIENVKDIVTDIIGLVIIVGTLYLLWHKDIVWVWDGIISIGIGCIFFVMPDDFLKQIISKVTGKYTDNPPNA